MADGDSRIDQTTSQNRTADPRLTQDEMAAVLSRSPAGVCITRGRIIHWANKTFHEMLGHENKSLLGKDGSLLYPSSRDYEQVGAKLLRTISARGAAMIDTELLRADGGLLDCRVRAAYLDPADPDQGLVVVITDITDVKSLQLQLQQSQKMEAIGVLAGGVSHDFNNLLMGIQGHLSLMRIHTGSPERIQGHIQQINKLVETAADLTRRLLGFARGGKYQVRTLDLNQVVSSALKIFAPTHRGIVVEAEQEKDLLPVDGDHSQMEQVVLNLLINGAQAMNGIGAITLGTRNIVIGPDHDLPFEVVPGPYVELWVQDRGVGMDKATQAKIFDPFFSTKKEGSQKGRGLGLSTVFGIVKNHGGLILVESRKGDGATFRVCLPGSSRPLAEMSHLDSGELELMPKGSETILFVDDEEEILNLGRNFLEKLGYETLLASNGLEAVELFKANQERISLVVLDLVMPVMGGKEVFLQIRNLSPQAKVLVSTGFTVDKEVKDLLRDGCHGFIQKPFSMHKFSRIIRDIIDRTGPKPVMRHPVSSLPQGSDPP